MTGSRILVNCCIAGSLAVGIWAALPTDANETPKLTVKLPTSSQPAGSPGVVGPPRRVLKNGGAAGKHACPAGQAFSEGHCEAMCMEGKKWDGKGCSAAPIDIAWVAVAPGMAWIRGGSFLMGSESGPADEQPSHYVTQRWPFALDRTEVSVADFGACVRVGVCSAPAPMTASDPLESDLHCNWAKETQEKHPMNCVDWNAARRYCEWAGKRLPTEAEWEYAARGTSEGDFVWGAKWPPPADVGNFADESSRELQGDGAVLSGYTDHFATTSPVRASRTNTFGVIGMSGNVQEWVEDAYSPTAYVKGESFEPLLTTGTDRVVRGGSWRTGTRDGLRAATRTSQPPSWRSTALGFRCAMTLD